MCKIVIKQAAVLRTAAIIVYILVLKLSGYTQQHFLQAPPLSWSLTESIIYPENPSLYRIDYIHSFVDNGFVCVGAMNKGQTKVMKKTVDGQTQWEHRFGENDSPTHILYTYVDEKRLVHLIGIDKAIWGFTGYFIHYIVDPSTGILTKSELDSNAFIGYPAGSRKAIAKMEDGKYIIGGLVDHGPKEDIDDSFISYYDTSGVRISFQHYSNTPDLYHKVYSLTAYDENRIILGINRWYRDSNDLHLKQDLIIRAVDSGGNILWNTQIPQTLKNMYASELLTTSWGRVLLRTVERDIGIEKSVVGLYDVNPISGAVELISMISVNEEIAINHMFELPNQWIALVGSTGNFKSTTEYDLASSNNYIAFVNTFGVLEKSYEWGDPQMFDGLTSGAVVDDNHIVLTGTAERNYADSIQNETQYYAIVDLTSLSITNTITGDKIELYPNPASDILFVESTDNNGFVSTVITDILGRVVYTSKSTVTTHSIRHLANGHYTVSSVNNQGKLFRASFVKR